MCTISNGDLLKLQQLPVHQLLWKSTLLGGTYGIIKKSKESYPLRNREQNYEKRRVDQNFEISIICKRQGWILEADYREY